MNIESLANYADVIGGVAVVVSLIYVGFQIHRNTKSSLSLTNQSAHESLANVSLEAAKDPDLSSLTRRGMHAFELLDEEEQFRFLLLMGTIFRRFENIYYQYRQGLLEEDLWEGYEQSMLLYFYNDGGQAFWKQRRHVYSKKFQNLLEATSADDVRSTL